MPNSDPYSDRLQQAQALIEQGDTEQALAVLYSVVAVAADHRDAWWLIARAAPHQTQRLEALKRVLQIDPDFAPARQMVARYGQFDVPTAQSPGLAPQTPAQSVPQSQAYPPAAAQQPPRSGPPPAPDYVSHPAQTPPPQPEVEPEPEKVKRDVVYVERKHLQPFLVVNGGCTSGCFSLVLTLITMAVLAFLLIGDQVSIALRNVGSLEMGERVSAELVPAIALTAVLAYLQTHPIALPFNLSALVAGAGAIMPDSRELAAGALQTLWTSLGFPANTGSEIMTSLGGVGSRLNAANWIPIAIFLGGWVLLAFFFVFLRARSMRFLHWMLSTIGLWAAVALAAGLGMVLFRLFFGA